MLTPCTHGHVRLSVLRAGRWLRVEHPTITEPAAWPRELCTAYVAAIDRIHVEDFAQRCDPPHDRLGHPLSARSKDVDLTRALATPRAIKALIDPRPRVIADDLWRSSSGLD